MLEEARLTSCNFVLSRSLLAVAQLGFVSGLFVPGFSRNPCQKGELDVWVLCPATPLFPIWMVTAGPMPRLC